MNAAEPFEQLKLMIEHRAELVVERFMSSRTGSSPSIASDLVPQIRTRLGGLTVEWCYRIWARAKSKKKGKRYRLMYLSRRKLLSFVRASERSEVIRAREQLDALIEVHKKIRRAEAKLGKLGLLAHETDILMDFVPSRSSVRVVSKGGTDASDD